jgi:hypothetical protein
VLTYSANAASLGASTGLEASPLALAVAAGAATIDETVWTWGSREDTPPTLLSTTESIALNLNGAAIPAGTSLYVTIEWTEDVS